MTQATTEAEVYNVISRNGAIRRNLQPSEAQLRFYARLVIRTGARFEAPDPSWPGRTKHQMSLMIKGLCDKLGQGQD